MSKVKQAVYNCTMAVLYVICNYGWNLYVKNWKVFAGINSKYTEAYGQAALKDIQTAKDMPDKGQRQSNSSTSKTKLEAASERAVLLWKRLRRLIVGTFSESDQAAMIQAAGGDHYTKATRDNDLAEVSLLVNAGANFIVKYTDALTAAGMPVTFADDYNTAKKDFDGQYSSIGGTKAGVSDDTKDKIEANNAIHASLMQMLEDAQTLFEDDLSTRSQFTFASLRKLVTKDVVSGIHFSIRDNGSSKPLSEAVITVDGEEEGTKVNAKGVLDAKTTKGIHTYTVVCEGYIPVTRTATVQVGVMKREIVKMVKVVNSEQ